MPLSLTDILQEDKSLKSLNTFGVDATARFYVNVQDEATLTELLQEPNLAKLPVLVLGGGSNMLFVDNYDGLVLNMAIKGRRIVRETSEHVWLQAGAGEIWHQLVMHCVEQGWGGIENLALIPGTVGAAPIQNIGAYGVELKDVFDSLEAVERESGQKRTFSKEECRFGYRDSVFKRALKGRYIITTVTLRLDKHPQVNLQYRALQEYVDEHNIENPTIRQICDAVIRIRKSKLPDPAEIGNAGSFFKNPEIPVDEFEELKEANPEVPGYRLEGGRVKVAAGWLIEQAGWKGRTVGNAGTHHRQALVLVNRGGAKGRELYELAKRIRNDVKQQFGIELQTEVNIIGLSSD